MFYILVLTINILVLTVSAFIIRVNPLALLYMSVLKVTPYFKCKWMKLKVKLIKDKPTYLCCDSTASLCFLNLKYYQHSYLKLNCTEDNI